LPVAADVADPTEPDGVVASAVEHFGSVDVLVNNAGRPTPEASWMLPTRTGRS